MRYFLNTSAAKPVVAEGQTFTFELVGLRGGSWLGILAIEEPGASILAAARAPNTDEIPLAAYEVQKKKSSVNQPNSPAWPKPTSQGPAFAVAEPAGNRMSRADSSAAFPSAGVGVPDHNSTSGITSVSILTTKNSPPVEPLLANTAKRGKPF